MQSLPKQLSASNIKEAINKYRKRLKREEERQFFDQLQAKKIIHYVKNQRMTYCRLANEKFINFTIEHFKLGQYIVRKNGQYHNTVDGLLVELKEDKLLDLQSSASFGTPLHTGSKRGLSHEKKVVISLVTSRGLRREVDNFAPIFNQLALKGEVKFFLCSGPDTDQSSDVLDDWSKLVKKRKVEYPGPGICCDCLTTLRGKSNNCDCELEVEGYGSSSELSEILGRELGYDVLGEEREDMYIIGGK